MDVIEFLNSVELYRTREEGSYCVYVSMPTWFSTSDTIALADLPSLEAIEESGNTYAAIRAGTRTHRQVFRDKVVKTTATEAMIKLGVGRNYLVKETANNLKENSKMDLYEFKHNGKTVHGTKLAVNSHSKWVMEVKGSGETVALDESEVEKVVPYTVLARVVGDGDQPVFFNIQVEKGSVDLHGLYLTEVGSIMFIKELDTKSESAIRGKPFIAKLSVEKL